MKKKMVAPLMQSELSIERTIMANHRTLLAYLRTAVGLIVAGAGLIKFIQNPVWVAIGVICVILTPFVMIVGICDYFRVNKLIRREKEFLSNMKDSSNKNSDMKDSSSKNSNSKELKMKKSGTETETQEETEGNSINQIDNQFIEDDE